MSGEQVYSVALRLIAIDPPFEPAHGVLFGLQGKKIVEQPVSASGTTIFDTEITIDSGDFKGRHVNGKKGDRFLYLSWGVADGSESFVMFARAKVKLGAIPEQVLAAAQESGQLVCELQATNHKGQPASGTIKDPAPLWRAEEPTD